MNNVNEIKRVALYIRVSTDKQAKEGDSLEAQEEALVKYCKEHNYIIVDKYIDGGESGQKIKRTNLQRMLEDVKEHKIDLILMTKLDRWFRSIADFYKVIEIIKENKTDWKTIWEDYDTTTASGEFWLNMSLAMGQLEAKRTAERINSVFDYKYRVQKTACSGSAPFGYKIIDGKYTLDEEKAPMVIALYEHYAESNNFNETTEWFSANYINKCYETIKKYLKNPAYIGKFKRYKDGEIIEDYIPPIVNQELWDRVNQLVQINVKNYNGDPNAEHHNKQPYIFTGMLKCKECGRNLSGAYNSNNTHYYRCKYYQRKKCTNNRCISEKAIEEYLLNKIIPLLEKTKEDTIRVNKKNEIIKDNSNIIRNKLKKLTNLYLEDLIDKDCYKEEYNKLQNQLIEIENRKSIEKENKKNKINYDDILEKLKKELPKTYNTLSNSKKREMWSSIIKEIRIKGKEYIKIIVY